MPYTEGSTSLSPDMRCDDDDEAEVPDVLLKGFAATNDDVAYGREDGDVGGANENDGDEVVCCCGFVVRVVGTLKAKEEEEEVEDDEVGMLYEMGSLRESGEV